jgi:hypothetical protein
MCYWRHHVIFWLGQQRNSIAFESSELFAALFALRHAGIDTDLMIDLNDSGMASDEIADYLDRNHVLTAGKC